MDDDAKPAGKRRWPIYAGAGALIAVTGLGSLTAYQHFHKPELEMVDLKGHGELDGVVINGIIPKPLRELLPDSIKEAFDSYHYFQNKGKGRMVSLEEIEKQELKELKESHKARREEYRQKVKQTRDFRKNYLENQREKAGK